MPVLLDSSRTPAPPPVEDVTRRDLLRGAGALGAARMLTACVAPPSSDPIAADSRRVEHPLGTAEVPTSPQRVVAVTGTVEVDALVAVGIVPVAAAELETGVGFGQQVADALEGAVMLGTRREIDIEAVAAQEPDLIIGTEGWLADPLFSALPAAQADRVFVVDSDHWYFVTPQAVAQILDDLEQDVLPRLTGAT